MSKTLIIAEKPDMAKAIAAVLNVPKTKGCYENEQFIVSNCIGHLIEFDVPEWRDKNASLPVIPQTFSLKIKEQTAQHYQFLRGLIHRADVSTLVNACDADRAGEHIFRLVYQHSGCLKPVKRMWIQSTTQQGLRQAFDHLKNGTDYDNLAAAEQCRAEADWLLGMNGSRALGNQFGRVMTPTLAMVVDAYLANKNFKPENYWEVSAQFAIQSGSYTAKLLDKNDKIARFADDETAQAACEHIHNQNTFAVNDAAETEYAHAPYLFDANELQKIANKKLGFAADKTLSIMQSLYEKHKVLTYPRSDFNALPDDYLPTLTATISGLGALAEYSNIVNDMQAHDLIKHNPCVFDDKRIGSHYAIVPTGFIQTADGERALSDCPPNVLHETLSADEYTVFHLVALRTLAALYPAAEYAVTTRITFSGSLKLRTTGRVLQKQGWLNVYGGIDDDEDKQQSDKLPPLSPDETAQLDSVSAKKLTTKAPPLMTESRLIQAMKTAGRDLDDKHLADVMKDVKGIGTSATRAPIIKKLKTPPEHESAYLLLEKNQLIPSQRALDAIAHVRQFFPETADPILTAEWEDKLHQIEHGQFAADDFRAEIHRFVKKFVATVLPHRPNAHQAEILCACPNCGSGSLQSQKFSWHCECGFKLYKEQRGRAMSADELRQLIEHGKTDLLQDFVSKEKGTKYAAVLKLERDDTGSLKIGMAFPERKTETCPCCSGSLHDKGGLYECECGFKLWKTQFGKRLTENQLKSLIEKGESGLIKGLNRKDGSTFDAALCVDKVNKKIGFVPRKK
ncbi:DNA topoisomerase [Kingella negevensis]|uniref:DNA topoisomerase n=1 Tax=Kingella negevensis TaxID=1522312 RepID=UPI00050A330A|nr:DNA topoisomerase [Kingella negevensis]MDK4688273.1 DNA topoisomerase [Kingella negevensis]